MRLAVIFITFMSVVFASLNKSIYELARQSSEISLVSLFVPLVFGLYWKRASAWGALGSMIIGLLVWLACTIIHTEYPPIIFGLLSSISAMVVLSLVENKKLTQV